MNAAAERGNRLTREPRFPGPFAFFLSAGVAEAEGFRYTCGMTAVPAVPVVGALTGALLTARSQGA